jgi:hypothetical protein
VSTWPSSTGSKIVGQILGKHEQPMHGRIDRDHAKREVAFAVCKPRERRPAELLVEPLQDASPFAMPWRPAISSAMPSSFCPPGKSRQLRIFRIAR